jgi:hypothetical protein
VFFEHCQRVFEQLKLALGLVDVTALSPQARDLFPLLGDDALPLRNALLCDLKLGFRHGVIVAGATPMASTPRASRKPACAIRGPAVRLAAASRQLTARVRSPTRTRKETRRA